MYGEIEGSGLEHVDKRFAKSVIGHARLQRHWTGSLWMEGPAWFPAGRYLIFSDIPNNRMLRWDECDGSVSVFRQPSQNSNGNTVDRQGRLVSCEHRSRQVTRTEHNGTITVIAEGYGGKRFNSPNDVVVKSDGSIWFTDPSYGIMSDYEGDKSESELPCCVYRVSNDGQLSVVADDFIQPNGLAFSTDESRLYVSDTGVSDTGDAPKHMRVFDVVGNGEKLSNSREFAVCNNGVFDGFRVDVNDQVWSSAADGVHCFDADGNLLGKVLVPEMVSNVCFGGAKLNHLFICGTSSLYSIYLAVNGQPSL
ncbi:MAG: SMP-30/gluconolactonase/LRE family protein [Gammaproteobacteria bacterium]|nr:SMP-30/gluconolactonase/LRE family protein [Gammaproteobacteria bacterium]